MQQDIHIAVHYYNVYDKMMHLEQLKKKLFLKTVNLQY